LRNLIVDIGNSRIKTAVFEDDVLISENSFMDFDLFRAFSEKLNFQHAIISSVTYIESQLNELLPYSFLFLNTKTRLPIQNKYQTPETLGVDRKAAVVGARAIEAVGNLLAIDLGSCITYDFLDDRNCYWGGAISPGLQMRFKAMHQQTARLPLVDLKMESFPDLIGGSTVSCMQGGVYFGILHELTGFIEQYQAKYKSLKVIICGGDSIFFESLTKDHIFVIPNLILYGLNRILSYNVNYQ
jgi:type III pantothenate kinase